MLCDSCTTYVSGNSWFYTLIAGIVELLQYALTTHHRNDNNVLLAWAAISSLKYLHTISLWKILFFYFRQHNTFMLNFGTLWIEVNTLQLFTHIIFLPGLKNEPFQSQSLCLLVDYLNNIIVILSSLLPSQFLNIERYVEFLVGMFRSATLVSGLNVTSLRWMLRAYLVFSVSFLDHTTRATTNGNHTHPSKIRCVYS